MNAWEERGLIIAALCKLNKAGNEWLVPSQSSAEIYKVNVQAQTCTCPDHKDAGFKCKHLYAVEITMKREVHSDGSVTDTQSITFTKKGTYKQDWTASAVKRKFGDSVRSKTDTAMVNETLCKFHCYNLCCLIQEQHELGIETVFWKNGSEVAATQA